MIFIGENAYIARDKSIKLNLDRRENHQCFTIYYMIYIKS